MLSLCLAALVAPASAFAQSSTSLAPRGNGGAFGGSSSSTSRDQLDLTASFIGAFDSEAAPELRARRSQHSLHSGGSSSMFTGGADYERRRGRWEVAAQGQSAFQYYPQLHRVVVLTHAAAIGATVRMARRSTFEISQTADYSPSYFYRLFPTVVPPSPGDVASAPPDYRVDESRSFANSSRATVSLGNVRTNRIGATIERQAATFSAGTLRPDLETVAGRAGFSRGLGRTATLSAEYEQRRGHFGYAGRGMEHRLRIGASISPALSTSRRAQLSGSVSPSLTNFESVPGSEEPTPRRHRLEAEASALYPFLRSWSLGTSYSRSTDYVALFRQPVFRDAGRVEAAGLVTRRVDVMIAAGYANGASAVSLDGSRFHTYTGSVRARYAFGRPFAVYAEYLYYHYNLRGQAALAPDVPAVFEQQGIRAGITVWARPIGR